MSKGRRKLFTPPPRYTGPDLPRDLSTMTKEMVEAVARYLITLSVPQLRLYQDIVHSQVSLFTQAHGVMNLSDKRPMTRPEIEVVKPELVALSVPLGVIEAGQVFVFTGNKLPTPSQQLDLVNLSIMAELYTFAVDWLSFPYEHSQDLAGEAWGAFLYATQ